MLVGGFLEVIVALAGIGTAVTLYPVLKRQNEGAALGFVARHCACRRHGHDRRLVAKPRPKPKAMNA